MNPHVLEELSQACEAVHGEVDHPHSVHTHHPHFVCGLCHRVECYEVVDKNDSILAIQE